MCSSTAQMLKRANPYCMYIIAAEFLKMDKGVTPEVTDIAEIFLLCKADNASRAKQKVAGDPPHAVYADVTRALFMMVIGHLQAVWWEPDTALERGKVISRPLLSEVTGEIGVMLPPSICAPRLRADGPDVLHSIGKKNQQIGAKSQA